MGGGAVPAGRECAGAYFDVEFDGAPDREYGGVDGAGCESGGVSWSFRTPSEWLTDRPSYGIEYRKLVGTAAW